MAIGTAAAQPRRGEDTFDDDEASASGAPSGRGSHDPLPALCLVARLHQVAAEPAALRHALGKTGSDILGVDDLLLAARHLGLKARRSRSTADG